MKATTEVIEIDELPTALTDAGRSETKPDERRDCTVRALAVAAGVTYETAHEALRLAGRKDGHGCFIERLIKRKAIPGFVFTRVGRSPRTVQRFLKEFPSGRYLCRKQGHAFAVIDGVIYDSGLRRNMERILNVWTVEVTK